MYMGYRIFTRNQWLPLRLASDQIMSTPTCKHLVTEWLMVRTGLWCQRRRATGQLHNTECQPLLLWCIEIPFSCFTEAVRIETTLVADPGREQTPAAAPAFYLNKSLKGTLWVRFWQSTCGIKTCTWTNCNVLSLQPPFFPELQNWSHKSTKSLHFQVYIFGTMTPHDSAAMLHLELLTVLQLIRVGLCLIRPSKRNVIRVQNFFWILPKGGETR